MILSIVIPIDLSRREKDILSRILFLTEAIGNENRFIVILGCNKHSDDVLNRVFNIVNPYANFRVVVSENCIDGNLSELRNIAISSVETRYLLFLDIDIIIKKDFLLGIFDDFLRDSVEVMMYPCLYLTSHSDSQLRRHEIEFFINAYYGYRRDLILHLAFPSSIVLVDTKSVIAIGGYDENFKGHGYEDFDFLTRLFDYKGLLSNESFSVEDIVYTAPLLSRGFRASLAEPFLDVLFTNNYFLHKYHSKDKEESFYSKRKDNADYFMKKIQKKYKGVDRNYFHLLNLFESKCLSRSDVSMYSILWSEIPSHMFRRKSFFKRFFSIIKSFLLKIYKDLR